VKNPRTFPKFPHCEVAFPHQDVCCEGCFVMCKCGEQMARRCGKLQKICRRQDGDFSDCRAPGLPNRTETQVGMANYEHKLAELTKAVQTEAAKWSRTKAEWNARGKAMK
jgi:hypothetical protein